jgi:glutamate/tyrosine decarboxylase-like PLP-dependent enzyme
MGIGVKNVVEINCDENHQIIINDLKKKIKLDKENGKVPIAIVGAAGTRSCGSFDNLKGLSEIAEQYKIWFHVDGAFGAFLKIADNRPRELDYLNLAHSITLDPHKLLFMPFDSGCLLVRDKQKLIDAFGTEGEYLEKFHPVGQDYCDFGIQLGRSMKGLNVWLGLKYFGINIYKKEYERLLKLASEFKNLIINEQQFELIGPSQSLIVCFRWKPKEPYVQENALNSRNEIIRTTLIKQGIAYINGVNIENTFALRVCLANYNTDLDNLKYLLSQIQLIADKL